MINRSVHWAVEKKLYDFFYVNEDKYSASKLKKNWIWIIKLWGKHSLTFDQHANNMKSPQAKSDFYLHVLHLVKDSLCY